MTPEVPEKISIRTMGENIRTLRKAKALTLKALSARSGVSIATISKIENGIISGGFETIYKTARGLGVLVTDIMVGEHTAAEPLVVHQGDAKDIHPTRIYDYFPQACRHDGALNPYLMTIHARTPPDTRDWSIHAGEEVIIVLSGAIELHLEGHDFCHLKVGDSVCFDCGIRHAFVCVSKVAARIISVSTRGLATREDGRLRYS